VKLSADAEQFVNSIRVETVSSVVVQEHEMGLSIRPSVTSQRYQKAVLPWPHLLVSML